MLKQTRYLLSLLCCISLTGCLCIPHEVTLVFVEAPESRKHITCHAFPFPPSQAIEFSFGEVTLQVNGDDDDLSIILCIPEENTVSIDPQDITILSENKELLETIEFHTMRINDFSGKRDITPDDLANMEGATKRMLGHEGYRRVALRAKLKSERSRLYYLSIPPIRINGEDVHVPLVKFTLKTVIAC